MGIEYKVEFSFPSVEAVEALLKADPLFTEFDPSSNVFNFRNAQNFGTKPDASARIHPYGLYFSNNGGSGLEVLQRLIPQIARTFGALQFKELE